MTDTPRSREERTHERRSGEERRKERWDPVFDAPDGVHSHLDFRDGPDRRAPTEGSDEPEEVVMIEVVDGGIGAPFTLTTKKKPPEGSDEPFTDPLIGQFRVASDEARERVADALQEVLPGSALRLRSNALRAADAALAALRTTSSESGYDPANEPPALNRLESAISGLSDHADPMSAGFGKMTVGDFRQIIALVRTPSESREASEISCPTCGASLMKYGKNVLRCENPSCGLPPYSWVEKTPEGPQRIECWGYWPDDSGQQCGQCGRKKGAHKLRIGESREAEPPVPFTFETHVQMVADGTASVHGFLSAWADRVGSSPSPDVYNPAADALDDITKILGAPEWEYPGQVVRDVAMAVGLTSEEFRSRLNGESKPQPGVGWDKFGPGPSPDEEAIQQEYFKRGWDARGEHMPEVEARPLSLAVIGPDVTKVLDAPISGQVSLEEARAIENAKVRIREALALSTEGEK